MKLKLEQLVLYVFICLLLYYLIILWGIYLLDNHYIQETFQPNVDVPLTTRYSCSNFCGPNAQCAFTREQCSTDYDCTGCKPKLKRDYQYKTKEVPGDDDAGKLTFSQTPQYSSLTTDIGTEASLYSKTDKKVPQIYWGVDKWTKSANQGTKYYLQNQRDNEEALRYDFEFQLNYPYRESATGIFRDSGPLAANS